MPVTNYYTAHGQLYAEETGGLRTDYLTDPLGSVIGTMNAAGQLVNTYRYKPFGGLLAKTGSGPDPSLQWVGSMGYRQTGKKWSDVYIRARHYDTQTGRWPTYDPLRGRHADYRYAGLAPQRRRDPSGLEDLGFGGIPINCKMKDQATLNDCCQSFLGLYFDPKAGPAISDCVRAKLPAVAAGDVALALGVARDMCYGRRRACVWCLSNDDAQNDGWPKDCFNKCQGDGYRIPGGWTPLPLPPKLRPFDPTQPGRRPWPPGTREPDPCPEPCKPLSQHDERPCDCTVAMCMTNIGRLRDPGTELCNLFLHELVHCSGPSHLEAAGQYDFVQALGCCICQTRYKEGPGSYDKCKVVCLPWSSEDLVPRPVPGRGYL